MIAALRYCALPLLSAVTLACAFPPLHMNWLAFLALLPLLHAAHGATVRDGALRFFLAGWVFHAILLNWLAANVFWAGFRALLGWQLLSVYLAVYWAVVGALWSRVTRADGHWRWTAGLAFAVLWVGMEWVQGWMLSGFGWSALGYTQTPFANLLQWAAVGGVHFLSFAIVSAGAMFVHGLRQRRHKWIALQAAAACSILVLLPLTGGWLSEVPSDKGQGTALLHQSAYSQLMKWDPDYCEDMVIRAANASLAAAAAVEPDLIVWPEALVMDDFSGTPYWDLLRTTATGADAWLFTGAVRDDMGGTYNTSVLVSPEGEEAAVYDKVHLAPFGEYVPLARYWPALDRLVPGGAVTPGDGQEVLDAGNMKLGPLICFEVLFPGMSERLRRDGASALVVVTNLGWFGFGAAMAQELEIARMRAVETRLPVIHAANTGITAVIDPWGRVEGPNGVVAGDGAYHRLRGGDPEPENTVMQRVFADHEVPAPARRPLGSAPRYFAPACAVLALFVLLAIGFAGRGRPEGKNIKRHSDEDQARYCKRSNSSMLGVGCHPQTCVGGAQRDEGDPHPQTSLGVAPGCQSPVRRFLRRESTGPHAFSTQLPSGRPEDARA